MDEIDRRILQLLQDAFPLTSRPWAEIAKKIGVSEKEILQRTKRLMSEGIVRQIGPIFDSRKIGFNASTLIAMKVPLERIDEVAKIINEFEGVTHNYQRTHEYNLWFTLAAKDDESLRDTIEKIKKITKIDEALDLPVSRLFKINARFEF